jgi:site-specific DNA-methyltransferase (adenine-specific)
VFNGQSNKSSTEIKDVEKRFTTQPAANNHPTVKPVKLMQYLVRLVTPKDGVCLDPFMGSGTTGVACKNLNRNFIGIELDEQYFEIAQQRINNSV